MREILRQSNIDLLREINRLKSVVYSASVLPELVTYQAQILITCEMLRRQGQQNLRDLDLNRDELLPDILSETQRLASWFRLYNERFAGPVLRSLPSDQLCLRIIAWLHDHHPETHRVPAALSDGGFGIWPEPQFPIVYIMPFSRQRGLLYLPLFFHEFGHLLYVCHEAKMDELVYELQKSIADLLESTPQQDDLSAQEGAKRRRAIAVTWYLWTQEIFCDAVGFAIGGPCFAYAFSMYLRTSGRDAFYLPRSQLEFSHHPVTWLRIHFLADQVRRAGWPKEAEKLENEWSKIAATMGVTEEYHGFYEDRFMPLIRKTIDDMLTVASPWQFLDEDVAPSEWDPQSSSPVHLLNTAWRMYLQDPASYDSWEEQAISAFLESHRNE